MQLPILSILIFFPLLGIGLLLFLDRKNYKVLKGVTFGVSVLEFIISLPLWFNFDSTTAAMQFVERHEWVPGYGVSYYIGIDGFSLLLIMLTTFLTPLCVLATWTDIQTRVKEFMVCLLALMSGMIGVFVSLDLFLFYVFWEVMLIPMYLLIGVWGNPARRVYAAIKFFLFTMFGSVLMLVAILVLYFHYGKTTGVYTFDLLKLYGLGIPFNMQFWMFLAFGSGLRHQGAHVPVPHLVAGRPHRSAHRGFRHPGRGTPEDGDLRLPALQHAALPPGGPLLRAAVLVSWRSSASSTAPWSP